MFVCGRSHTSAAVQFGQGHNKIYEPQPYKLVFCISRTTVCLFFFVLSRYLLKKSVQMQQEKIVGIRHHTGLMKNVFVHKIVYIIVSFIVH